MDEPNRVSAFAHGAAVVLAWATFVILAAGTVAVLVISIVQEVAWGYIVAFGLLLLTAWWRMWMRIWGMWPGWKFDV